MSVIRDSTLYITLPLCPPLLLLPGDKYVPVAVVAGTGTTAAAALDCCGLEIGGATAVTVAVEGVDCDLGGTYVPEVVTLPLLDY